jgi:hypothetical protein
MPTPTYDLIASNVLGSSAASVTFSSIPATYRDLVLVVTGVSSTAANRVVNAQFNSDTGSNYSTVRMYGDGTTAPSDTTTTTSITVALLGATSPAMGISSILDYSVTDKHKTVLSRGDNSASMTFARASRWANTAAINTISLFPNNGDFVSGASFYLYGIVS